MTATLKTTVIQEPSSATPNLTLNTSGGVNFGATSTVATLPIATTTGVETFTNKTLTSPTLTSPTITGALVSSMASSVITLATAQASTSGTAVDFTGIPSWVRRITVMFQNVSTTTNTGMLVQLGNTTFVTTGYVSASDGTLSTAGLFVRGSNLANTVFGLMIITNTTGNSWTSTHAVTLGTDGATSGGGGITLSSVLDRVRITPVSGNFDAGSINIMYE